MEPTRWGADSRLKPPSLEGYRYGTRGGCFSAMEFWSVGSWQMNGAQQFPSPGASGARAGDADRFMCGRVPEQLGGVGASENALDWHHARSHHLPMRIHPKQLRLGLPSGYKAEAPSSRVGKAILLRIAPCSGPTIESIPSATVPLRPCATTSAPIPPAFRQAIERWPKRLSPLIS
jgi:hypothetical protein